MLQGRYRVGKKSSPPSAILCLFPHKDHSLTAPLNYSFAFAYPVAYLWLLTAPYRVSDRLTTPRTRQQARCPEHRSRKIHLYGKAKKCCSRHQNQKPICQTFFQPGPSTLFRLRASERYTCHPAETPVEVGIRVETLLQGKQLPTYPTLGTG